MAAPEIPLVDMCPSCGLAADVSVAEPFSETKCVACGETRRVRRTFDHFEILGELGVGGMSRVFDAVDTSLARRVALKILNRECSQDAARLAQFEREARLTASFSHPHIVKVFSVGRDQNHFYIAMELVPGGSLDDRIRRSGVQSEAEVLALAIELVQGLRAAHTAGLIHRDIKPGNILYAEDGRAKIVDFGLALIQGKDVDESDELWATPFYVPPEKLYGEPDTYRGDMYSLGAAIFHALAGRPPCVKETNSIEELRKIKNFPVHLGPLAPQVSEETCAIIDRLLARKPEHRYRNYDELLEHFEFALKHLRSGGRKQSRHAVWWGRNAPRVAAAAAVLVGLGLSALFFSRQKPSAQGSSGTPLGEISADAENATTTRFLQARQSLLDGHPQQARELFRGIATAPGTRQPTLNWAWFNVGLCELLEGRRDTAREAFQALAQPVSWAATPEAKELSEFFQDVATALTQATPRQSEIARYSGLTVQGVALLPLGLRAWEDGHIELAAEFFSRFREATPPPNLTWIVDYKSLLEPYLADLEAAKTLPVLDENMPIELAREVATRAGKVMSAMRIPRGLKPRLEAELAAFRENLRQREQAALAVRATETARRLEEDMTRIALAMADARPLRSGYRFLQGADSFRNLALTSPAAIQKRDDLVYLWAGAEDFMELLRSEIEANRFSGDIERFGLPPLKGIVTRASRDKWLVRTGTVDQVVDVGMLPPAFLISLAEKFADQTADSDQHYRARENIIAFAKVCQLNGYAKVAGQALANEFRAFGERWSRLSQLN
ncbi:MAG: serine/threonine-protein kinase [Verrucomicrobiales bacterium]